MNIQAFKMIAQSSIDDVFEHIDYLKQHINEFPESEKSGFNRNLDTLEEDMDSLIIQYNTLEEITEDSWDETIHIFKTSKDNLIEKLNQFSIQII